MTQPLRLEDIVEKALAARPAHRLLTGLGAKISIASDLPLRRQTRECLATGIEPLDRLLPGGLLRGQLIEIVGRRSSGRFSIGLATLASVTSAGEPAVLLDPGEHLDPRAAAAAGVDLELLLWVRPRRVKEMLAAAEMLLAAGFPLVVADFGLSARGGSFVPDAAWIRLARASQAQDSALLLLTPYRMSGIAAEAVVTADTVRPLWQGAGRTPRLLTALSSRLTLQKLARTTPGTSQTLSLSVPGRLPPLPAGEGRGEGTPLCHPGPIAPACHPEPITPACHPERSEGSAPAASSCGFVRDSLREGSAPVTSGNLPEQILRRGACAVAIAALARRRPQNDRAIG